MEEMIKKVIHKKPKASLGAIVMCLVENIVMEKVLVNSRGLCLDDKDLVSLLGELVVVGSLNIKNVIHKVKVDASYNGSFL
jgi:hypothetical protein